MDPTVLLVTMVRMMRDYQQTIDSLLSRIAELEAQQQLQLQQPQHTDGVAAPQSKKVTS